MTLDLLLRLRLRLGVSVAVMDGSIKQRKLKPTRIRGTSGLIPPVLLVLAACGGGGGGSGGSPTVSNLTSWNSISYPSVVTASAVGYEGNYSYNTGTGQITSVGAASVTSNSSIALTYNSSGTLTAASVVTANQTQNYDNFAAANANGTLTFGLKSNDSGDWALATEPTSSLLNWKYQSIAIWTDPDGLGSGKYGAISAGAETNATTLPTSGTASFTGAGGGFYTDVSNNVFVVQSDISATANFATSQLTVNSTNSGKQQYTNGNFGSYSNDANLNYSGTLTNVINGSEHVISGTLTTTSGLSGPAEGRFYGANGAEVGGAFNLTGGGQTFVGAFGAKQ